MQPEAERAGELVALLRQRIAAQGPLSFRDFMETALYHPRLGYYTTLAGFGARGDFITSPEVHPVFGALLGRQAYELWVQLAQPDPFHMLELGAGAGTLAASLIDWARVEQPTFAAALGYTIDEPSPSLRRTQESQLAGYGVSWEPAAEPHLLLANEVLDAFPVYRVAVRDGVLRELRVGLDASDAFVWVEAPTAPAEVQAYFDRLRILPPAGGVAEVNAGLVDWARRVHGKLRRGLALILDYGYTAEDLFSRPQGTLLTYYRHTLGSDPLVRVGRQDVSTHVDFTTLASAAHHAGLRVLGMTGQVALLENLGLGQYLERLPEPQDRRALAQLVDSEGLGRIQALFLGADLGDYVPTGLRGGGVWPSPRHVPSLPAEPPPAAFMEMWREAFGDDDEPAS